MSLVTKEQQRTITEIRDVWECDQCRVQEFPLTHLRGSHDVPLPHAWIKVDCEPGERAQSFCSWLCLMYYAAHQSSVTVTFLESKTGVCTAIAPVAH